MDGKQYLSIDFTLHRSDKAAWAAPLDLRLACNIYVVVLSYKWQL